MFCSTHCVAPICMYCIALFLTYFGSPVRATISSNLTAHNITQYETCLPDNGMLFVHPELLDSTCHMTHRFLASSLVLGQGLRLSGASGSSGYLISSTKVGLVLGDNKRVGCFWPLLVGLEKREGITAWIKDVTTQQEICEMIHC